MMTPVFMIGWDGATFDLIRPWVAQGKLPTFARLMAAGAHGPLRSTLPPMTFPAWSSFMTGTNPGKHGIYDFTRPQPGRYELEFVNGGQRRAPSFWQLLSQAGRRVVSISLPCTYPPEPVNGVMISGFDAPGLGGSGAHVDARGMYPPELYDELCRNVGHHPIDSIVSDIARGRPEAGLERSLETIRQKSATAKYLLQRQPWDCFMILFGESDGVGHHYWKYVDRASPLFEEHPAGLADSILKVYQELDRQTAALMELLPDETNVLMMSDHGFGGIGDWLLYPNCWLREQGMLRFRGGAAHWRSRLMEAAKLRAVTLLPGWIKHALYQLSPAGLGGFESRVRYTMIDWSGTEVYFDENPYYPAAWVNLKGRQPGGIVEPGRHYEQVRDRLIERLEAWRHPETGDPIVEKAYRREEVYSGPCLDEAPDVVVKWGLHQGYNYGYTLSSKSPDLRWIERIDPRTPPKHCANYTDKSGTHRDDGIFLAWGPDVRAGVAVESARLIDLAPTLLHLLDVPVPVSMDGRVLEEVLTEKRPVEHTWEEPVLGENERNGGYSSEDEETIAARLKSLGYME
jgi:predicted AlkP superfamily phosphohydrolase/phosphomutase